ncbi:MAG: response regulator [Lachnospiraceae bacterium]|nr:response regulator [Lachnospiraceae bacterium]
MTEGIALIVATATLTTSVIIVILGIMFRFRYHKEIPLTYLGIGIAVISIWNMASSYLALYMMMIMPLPFMLYMNGIQNKRYSKTYRMVGFALFVEIVLFSILLPAGLLTFDTSYLYITLISVGAIIPVIITFIMDICKGFVREYLVAAVILACIWLTAFSRIALFFIRGSLQRSTLLPAGLILLQILAVINALHELSDMENQRQRAIFANEAKGKFLANMSHEIRTPINAVLGMDTMILRESTEPKIREYAFDIQNAGQSLLSLINDILDLSKIESGKLELLPHEYDLGRLIHDTINMIDAKAESKGLVLHTDIDRELPSGLYGDSTRLRQILINLMNNAVKYTEKGSVTLSVSGVKNEGMLDLTFHVKDTGIGIRKEDMPKLFAEFERIEEERNRNIEGTGLGMSITTQLLGLMDSRLEADSVYGEGSDFFFTLRQKIVDEKPVGDLAEQIRRQADNYSYKEAFTAPEAVVLVTDDNAMNRKVFINLLKSTGITTEEASCGMECIERTKKKHYDIIFLDHMMPDLDGIETLHRILQDNDNPCRTSPIIALTANAIVGAKEMYLSEGFHDFLSKPIDPDELEKMIMNKLPEDKIHHAGAASDAAVPAQGTPAQSTSEQDKLPEVQGIDWKVASLRFKSRDLLQEAVHDFYRMAGSEADKLETFLEQMSRAIRDGDNEILSEAVEQYGIRVHSMKSSSATIGATWLPGTAKLLEDAAKNENTELIMAVTPAFLNDWRHTVEALKPLCQTEGAASTPITEENSQTVKEALTTLDSAMADLDIDTADEIMEKLKQYIFPEPLPGLIEKLDMAVANLDGTQTAELVKEILSNDLWR